MTYGLEGLRPPARRGCRRLRPGAISIQLPVDAGAIRNDDPYSSTGMNASEIADLAAAKGVKIFALHLKTSVVKQQSNHDYAQIHDDVANWTGFGAKEPGDAVYRVPLNLMP